MAMLAAQHIMKQYGKRQVVNDVSLHVQSNEIVGLLGPNGAGKTTSFYMLVGLVRTDGGAIFYNELDITHYPMHKRAQMGVGYLPQEASVFRKLSVEDNLRAVLELRKDLKKPQINMIIDDLLNEFSISHIRESKGMALSGGERRRVEIARALATDPEFILLDEPFAGVDPLSVLEIQSIIAHLKERNIGVLITEHNVRETLGICDRAYILNAGNVIAEGTTAEVIANEEVRKVYLGDDFSL